VLAGIWKEADMNLKDFGKVRRTSVRIAVRSPKFECSAFTSETGNSELNLIAR
jgi:hypothetical protein